MEHLHTTICALATPPGEGGIATVRVSGPDAYGIVGKIFAPVRQEKSVADAKGYTAMLGHYLLHEAEMDECVALFFRAPHSYTGEDVIELSVHGGTAMADGLLEALITAGCAPAGPGEFTRRALENGRMSLTQAEAVMEVIAANGRQGAALAKSALDGRLAKRIGKIQTALQTLNAHLTAWVDYPEEDVPEVEEQELLLLAASLEQRSDHPLSLAVREKAKGMSLLDAENFATEEGRGVSALLGGRRVIGGNRRMMAEHGVPLGGLEAKADELAEAGCTPLFFAQEEQLLGLIAVADVVKPTSHEAVRELRALGVDVVMLTGDNRRTAAAIGRELEIPHVVAEVLPQDKEREVRRLQEQGRKVAMIGDGVNDAPALARADVGVAIGAGTDVAIESADVVLMKSDLLDAVTAVQLSHATIKNIKQNLFWAFIYNLIGIPIAAGLLYPINGLLLNPMLASAAMAFSSVSVVLNSLRLRY